MSSPVWRAQDRGCYALPGFNRPPFSGKPLFGWILLSQELTVGLKKSLISRDKGGIIKSPLWVRCRIVSVGLPLHVHTVRVHALRRTPRRTPQERAVTQTQGVGLRGPPRACCRPPRACCRQTLCRMGKSTMPGRRRRHEPDPGSFSRRKSPFSFVAPSQCLEELSSRQTPPHTRFCALCPTEILATHRILTTVTRKKRDAQAEAPPPPAQFNGACCFPVDRSRLPGLEGRASSAGISLPMKPPAARSVRL